MSLFTKADFISHAGFKLTWKIEADALTPEDWACVASIIGPKLPDFDMVAGIPNGGLPFARALQPYAKEKGRLLIADDIYTTGMSMEGARKAYPRESIGVVLFSRAPTCPAWITPVFSLHPAFCEGV